MPTDANNSQEKQTETPIIDEDALEIMGEDPLKNRIEPEAILPEIASRLTHWKTVGLKKEERDALLMKYPPLSNCPNEAPRLNEEVIYGLSDATIKRDKHFSESQGIMGLSITCIAKATELILNDQSPPPYRNQLLGYLWDAGKLNSDLFYSESKTRKAFITPGMTKPIKEILDKAETNELLFGSGLDEKFRKVKDNLKSGKEIKPTQSYTSNKTPFKPSNSSGNSRSQLVKGATQQGNKYKTPASRTSRSKQHMSQSYNKNRSSSKQRHRR